jgi:hypothetical protein
MICWAPLLLAGYFFGIETPWHHQADISGMYAEVQTCRDGFGTHLKAGQGAWVAGGIHYGATWDLGNEWALTVQPAVGLSYFNNHHPLNGQRQIGRFEVGVGVLVSKGKFVVGGELLHQSNGEGWKPTNVGIDGVGLKAGWTF